MGTYAIYLKNVDSSLYGTNGDKWEHRHRDKDRVTIITLESELRS
jgi:hypothetical protein